MNTGIRPSGAVSLKSLKNYSLEASGQFIGRPVEEALPDGRVYAGTLTSIHVVPAGLIFYVTFPDGEYFETFIVPFGKESRYTVSLPNSDHNDEG